MSPLQTARESDDTAVTHFSVRSDQSGIIGLMRHLQRAWLYLHLHNL